MNVLKFNLQISNTKQGDCSDDEVDPDVESSLPEQPTPGQVLHIDSADAQRLTGSLMNDLEFRVEFRIPIRIPLTTQKVVEPLQKVMHQPKITENCMSARKNCASASNIFLFTNQTAGSPAMPIT